MGRRGDAVAAATSARPGCGSRRAETACCYSSKFIPSVASRSTESWCVKGGLRAAQPACGPESILLLRSCAELAVVLQTPLRLTSARRAQLLSPVRILKRYSYRLIHKGLRGRRRRDTAERATALFSEGSAASRADATRYVAATPRVRRPPRDEHGSSDGRGDAAACCFMGAARRRAARRVRPSPRRPIRAQIHSVARARRRRGRRRGSSEGTVGLTNRPRAWTGSRRGRDAASCKCRRDGPSRASCFEGSRETPRLPR